jgi:hypothetical protein
MRPQRRLPALRRQAPPAAPALAQPAACAASAPHARLRRAARRRPISGHGVAPAHSSVSYTAQPAGCAQARSRAEQAKRSHRLRVRVVAVQPHRRLVRLGGLVEAVEVPQRQAAARVRLGEARLRCDSRLCVRQRRLVPAQRRMARRPVAQRARLARHGVQRSRVTLRRLALQALGIRVSSRQRTRAARASANAPSANHSLPLARCDSARSAAGARRLAAAALCAFGALVRGAPVLSSAAAGGRASARAAAPAARSTHLAARTG